DFAYDSGTRATDKPARATVGDDRVGLAQFGELCGDLRHEKHRLIGIEAQDLQGIGRVVRWVLPHRVRPLGIEWPHRCDANDRACLVELAAREWRLLGELVLRRTGDEDVAVELA